MLLFILLMCLVFAPLLIVILHLIWIAYYLSKLD